MRYGIIVKMIHRHPDTTNNALRLPMRNIKIRPYDFFCLENEWAFCLIKQTNPWNKTKN